jgi:hypothetical protein
MMAQRTFWFRVYILIFACVLAAQAAWLLAAEFIRPTLEYFPQDKISEERTSTARQAAVMAASIGRLRGELWTEAAIALSSGLLDALTDENGAQKTAKMDRAKATAQRAARLSPHDSRTWLLLAALDSQYNRPNREVANYLKMSYLTGPNGLALDPLRLHIATRSGATEDVELQSLVAQEIRSIVLRRQDLKPSLLAVYRDASPQGKKIIETTVGDLDKNFLTAIRGSSGGQ